MADDQSTNTDLDKVLMALKLPPYNIPKWRHVLVNLGFLGFCALPFIILAGLAWLVDYFLL